LQDEGREMNRTAEKIIMGKKGNMALKSVESQNVEFKSNWRDEYLKVISAFVNTDGGKLMIAMNEKGNRK